MHGIQQKGASNLFTLPFAVAALVFCLTGASAVARAADPASLLEQARTSASQLRQDADQMQGYANSNLSWKSHGQQINMIKEHVNKLGELLSQMHEARGDASHTQQQAIDRISPLLEEIASNTTAVINHLNEHPNRTWNPNYKNYVAENARLTTELSGAINDFVEYDRTKSRMEELEQKLSQGS